MIPSNIPETPHPWQDEALCAEVGGDMFFPAKGGSTRDARKICAACPVAAACLQYALDQGFHDGIWGGRTPRERRRLLRERAA